jgi:hypothetical protein
VSSRTRLPEGESEFTWEEPYGSSPRRRRTPSRRPPRKVALPVVGIALIVGLAIGWLVSGGGSTTTVTEMATVTTAAAPAAPVASGPESRPTIALAILNGSGEDGLAASTAELMRGMGYAQITEGNAPSQVAADRVLYRPGAEAEALQVAADLNAAPPSPLADASGVAEVAPDADVVAIMGPPAASSAGQGTVEDAGDAAGGPAGQSDVEGVSSGSGSPE